MMLDCKDRPMKLDWDDVTNDVGLYPWCLWVVGTNYDDVHYYYYYFVKKEWEIQNFNHLKDC